MIHWDRALLVQIAALGSIVAVAALPSAGFGQDSIIEPDAPERRVAGCYAVTPPVPPRPVAPPEDRRLAVLPDTLRLSLSLDHYGAVWEGHPWRSAGWLLRLYPDPWPGFHSFAHWRLDSATKLILEWTIGFGPGPDFGTKVKQIAVAERTGSDRYVGAVLLRAGPMTIDSMPIQLTRTNCPEESYFQSWNWMMRAQSSGR